MRIILWICPYKAYIFLIFIFSFKIIDNLYVVYPDNPPSEQCDFVILGQAYKLSHSSYGMLQISLSNDGGTGSITIGGSTIGGSLQLVEVPLVVMVD